MADGLPARARTLLRRADVPTGKVGWRETGGWVGALTLVTVLMVQARSALGGAHIVLAYLLLVLGASARGGRVLGLSLALLAFACFNFFFVPPYHTFAVADPLDWLVLGAFLVTSAVAAQLLANAQAQAAEAQLRAADVDRLATVGAEALNANRAEDALSAIADVIRVGLGVARCEIHLGGDGAPMLLSAWSGAPRTSIPQSSGRNITRPLGTVDTSRLIAWVAEHGRPAVVRCDGTQRFSDSVTTDDRATQRASHGTGRETPSFDLRDARFLFVPLQARGTTVGVLALLHHEAMQLDPGSRRLLSALGYYAALGAERVRLAAVASRADALREADRLKDALLASVSHDLRTPLTTIKALAHAIGTEGDDRAVTIEAEADRLNRFVADLLDLSRLNGGAVRVTLEVNAAEDVLGVALERVTGAANGRELAVSLDPAEALLLGRFDFTHTLRILVNLIENALKYSPSDVPIEIHAGRIGDHREMLEFSVADRGPGVPEGERAQIFEPFYRPTGSVPDIAGAGLGLSIARRLAEAQGGRLEHHARPGGGSLFTLCVAAVDVSELANDATAHTLSPRSL